MKEMICRLCLQTIGNNNCQPIEEFLLKSLKLNINIAKEIEMCIECAHRLRVFSNFTPGCAFMEEKTLPLSDLDNGIKLDPEAIETTTNLKPLMEAEIKCSFCTKAHGREDLISLEDSKENKFMVNMLEQYISDTNLKSAKEVLACKTCLESLEGALSVIYKCLEVEEKISKYIELEGTDDKGQVELKKVQQFTFRPILKLEIESFGVNELGDESDQVQEEYTTMAEAEIKYEKETRNTELIIKTEDEDIKSEQSDCDIPDIKSEESDCDGFQDLFIGNQSSSEIKTFQCEAEIKMFKCDLCLYETKHINAYKRHVLIHKSPSEKKMFKCELCSHKTKCRDNLKRHILTHKNPSEIRMFECALCSYDAKRRYDLKRHLLTHNIHASGSEIEMFKCELCPLETRYKSTLKTHLLTHKSPFEIKMFKCELCSHKTKCRANLKRHILTHKNPSEIRMFECALCSYEAKRRYDLKRHLLTHNIHASGSEIEMFKCELCPLETRYKSTLKTHLLTHKSPFEIKMFKCELCSYEAKQKVYLKRHLLSHKSPSKIEMFKCEICSYETKWKHRLKEHLLIHKDPSDINMFKCELCTYEAKRKYRLKRHLLTHKSPSR